MKTHLPANPAKRDYAELFRQYGHGVPNQVRAQRSAANALSLIIQDTIIPYRPSATAGADPVHNQMGTSIFDLFRSRVAGSAA